MLARNTDEQSRWTHRRYQTLGLVIFSLTACSLALPILAAESNVEETIVTAQRREQRLNDVPISLTAFSAETIEQNQMRGARDYLQLTPNVNFVENDSQGTKNGDISIRGVSDLTSGTNERGIQSRPAIGLYVDDFSVAHIASGSANPPLDNIERIEILRGPQGTFFGRNATGGAINIITKKPGANRHAKLKAGFGSFDRYEVGGLLNLPISQQLMTHLAVSYSHSDGAVENKQPGGNSADEENINVKFAVRWLPRNWTIDFTAQLVSEQLGNEGRIPTGALPSNLLLGVIGGPNSDLATCGLGADILFPHNTDANCNNGSNFTEIDNTLYSLRTVYAAERFHLTTITGVLRGRLDQFQDIDDTGVDIFNRANIYKSKSLSEEVRISSAGDWQLAGMPWIWTLGGTVYWDEERLRNAIIAGQDVAPTLVNLTVPGDRPNENTQTVKRDGWAIFADLSLDVAPTVRLSAGLRYSRDNDEQRWDNTWASFGCGTREVVGGVAEPLLPGCSLRPDQAPGRVYADNT